MNWMLYISCPDWLINLINNQMFLKVTLIYDVANKSEVHYSCFTMQVLIKKTNELLSLENLLTLHVLITRKLGLL